MGIPLGSYSPGTAAYQS